MDDDAGIGLDGSVAEDTAILSVKTGNVVVGVVVEEVVGPIREGDAGKAGIGARGYVRSVGFLCGRDLSTPERITDRKAQGLRERVPTYWRCWVRRLGRLLIESRSLVLLMSSVRMWQEVSLWDTAKRLEHTKRG